VAIIDLPEVMVEGGLAERGNPGFQASCHAVDA
jgi:hypothetical protein